VLRARGAGITPRFVGGAAWGLRPLSTAPPVLGRARPSGGNRKRPQEEEQQLQETQYTAPPVHEEEKSFYNGGRVAETGEKQIDAIQNKAAVKVRGTWQAPPLPLTSMLARFAGAWCRLWR